jgi:hypothetical protein
MDHQASSKLLDVVVNLTNALNARDMLLREERSRLNAEISIVKRELEETRNRGNDALPSVNGVVSAADEGINSEKEKLVKQQLAFDSERINLKKEVRS